MKTSKTILLTALAVGISTLLATAQNENKQGPGGNRPPRQGGEQGGPGQGGQQRVVPPIMAALDANHDGVIDEKEIANASNALKTLDKNGDGKLTPDEIRPRAAGQGGPGGQGGEQGGPRGPRGPRGPGGGGQGQPPGE
jgi:hypothetical protein